jgi:hypothetical protein
MAQDHPDANPADVSQCWLPGAAATRDALEQLTPLVYRELHRLARGAMRGERPGHTLQTTALVHEAFIALAGARSTGPTAPTSSPLRRARCGASWSTTARPTAPPSAAAVWRTPARRRA